MAQSLAKVLERAEEMEAKATRDAARKKTEKLMNRIATERLTGSVAALAATAAGGYIDGRYDVSGHDEVAGDGTKVFGVAVVPVAGALALMASLAFKGPAASHVGYAGLGIVCGWAYREAARKGSEAAAKAASE